MTNKEQLHALNEERDNLIKDLNFYQDMIKTYEIKVHNTNKLIKYIDGDIRQLMGFKND